MTSYREAYEALSNSAAGCMLGSDTAERMLRSAASRFDTTGTNVDDYLEICVINNLTWHDVCRMYS